MLVSVEQIKNISSVVSSSSLCCRNYNQDTEEEEDEEESEEEDSDEDEEDEEENDYKAMGHSCECQREKFKSLNFQTI